MTTALPQWPPVDVWGAPPAGPQGDLGRRLRDSLCPLGALPGRLTEARLPCRQAERSPCRGCLPGHRHPRPSGPGCQRAAPTVRKGDVTVTCSLRLSEPIRPAIAWAHRTAAIQRQAPRALAGCAGPVIRERVWLTGVLSLGLSALGKSHVKEYLPTCSRPSDQRNLLVFGRSKNQHLLMVR